MKLNSSIRKETQEIFQKKFKRRQGLAKLPFEEKILILIQLQKIASGLPSNRQEAKRWVWDIRAH